MTGRERYGAVLRAPHVASLLALAVIARASIGINGLAIVLVVREATGSYAAAGGAAAALVAGIAISAPLIGRIVDRLGARRLLLALAVGQASALLAIAALAQAGAGGVVIGLTAFVAGCAQPPIGGVLRTMWADLIDPELLTTAFALDSISVVLAFVAGPLIVAVAAALDEPRVALVIAACATLGGTAAFTASEPVRRRVPTPGDGSGGHRSL